MFGVKLPQARRPYYKTYYLWKVLKSFEFLLQKWGQEGPDGGNTGVFGGLVTPACAPLEASWNHLKPILRLPGAILSPHGLIFGPSRTSLEPSWVSLDLSWVSLELLWAYLGPPWSHPDPFFGPSGSHFRTTLKQFCYHDDVPGSFVASFCTN